MKERYFGSASNIRNDADSDFPIKLLDKDRMISQLAFQNRKLMVYDDVDDSSMFRCIYTLMRIREADKKLGTKEPIEILINSCGGTVYDGLSLISLIENMKDDGYTIITTNMGYAFSMGFLISIVGSVRKSFRYATYLHHDMSSMNYGKLAFMEEEINDMRILRKRVDDIVLKYTKLTQADLDEINNKKLDKRFTAEEALALKICDEVL